jgi:opacity protein-like surface antigen
MKRWGLLCAVIVLFSIGASAQEENPKVEVYGGYSLIHNSTNFASTGINFQGGSGSLSYNPNHWIGLVGDFGANHWSAAGVDATVVTYLFGPKLAYRTDKFTPFAQVLFGGAHLSGSANACDGVLVALQGGIGCGTASENAFAMTVGGGLDWNVTPHIAIRPVQLEYLMTRFSGFGAAGSDTQNSLRYGAGVVFRF